jgi:hypothetical protein
VAGISNGGSGPAEGERNDGSGGEKL